MHPGLDSLGARGLQSTSSFRACPGLNSLGKMGLQGTCASKAYSGLVCLDATSRKVSTGATGGTIWVSRRAKTWAHPVDEVLRWEKACSYDSV